MSVCNDRRIGIASQASSLEDLGFEGLGTQFWNLAPPLLVEAALARREGELTQQGALAFQTGKYTGRSPRDKFLVRAGQSEAKIDWGTVNQPFEPDRFDAFFARVRAHLQGRDVWVVDAFAGTDPRHRLPIRVVCERAYHALFSHQLFVNPSPHDLYEHTPQYTIIAVPDLLADPARDGTRSEVAVLLDLERGLILIAGTRYAGEIKKSVFTLLNYLLPLRGVLSMHCSANMGHAGDVALFFGLSGTGKTTLSADPARALIGDDEHGWSDAGVFNIEGGCYAKCIRLNRLNEPEIFGAIRFGTVLENVVLDPTSRAPDFADSSLTENTRAAYPIEFISHHVPSGRAGHPRHILFLTCDAFGVLPPVARLTNEQAMYHFLSGYTAKVAGTERGLGNEPEAVFSTCFGGPFMVLPPSVYADLLGERMRAHRTSAWLVNTGWAGGPVGQGHRIALPHTRALVDAVINGTLSEVSFATDPIFGLEFPQACPEVPADLLNPRNVWNDRAAYETQARQLAHRFQENFKRFPNASEAIRAAGPKA